MRYFDFNPNELPKPILQGLGLIAAVSAQNEDVIQTGLAAMLGVDVEYGVAITSHLNAPQRDNMLRAAAEIRIDNLDHLDELDDLLDEIQAATKARNNYLHHSVGREVATGECFLTKYSARGSVQVVIDAIDEKKIEADARRLYEAGMRLMSFFMKIGLEPLDIPEGRANRSAKSRAQRKLRKLKL